MWLGSMVCFGSLLQISNLLKLVYVSSVNKIKRTCLFHSGEVSLVFDQLYQLNLPLKGKVNKKVGDQ